MQGDADLLSGRTSRWNESPSCGVCIVIQTSLVVQFRFVRHFQLQDGVLPRFTVQDSFQRLVVYGYIAGFAFAAVNNARHLAGMTHTAGIAGAFSFTHVEVKQTEL